GHRFIDLLARKARQGVKVRVLYDWFGCGMGPLVGLFRPLTAAGGEVRVFNPPRFAPALGWIRRDHRKLLTIDSTVAFVSGLCIGQAWEGRPSKGQDPWRDTGTEIKGPAVAFVEQTFAGGWRVAGGTLDLDALMLEDSLEEAGTVSLRLIPTAPFTGAMF